MIEIDKIQEELKKPLPGKVIQYKMAPSDRVIRDQAVNVQEIKRSAVLILLFYKNDELHILLTQRASYNGPHSGQISFPGGKFEATKDNNLQDTVIRETREEISLKPETYEILGELTPLIIPISKITVQPFLAYCSNISQALVDGYEITDLYQIPISHLLKSTTVKTKQENNLEYPYFDFKGNVIWGATAMMLSELLEIISRSKH